MFKLTIAALLSTVLVAFVMAAPYPEEKFLSLNEAAEDAVAGSTDTPVEGSGEDTTAVTGATETTDTSGSTGVTEQPVTTTTKSASTILSSVVLIVTAAMYH